MITSREHVPIGRRSGALGSERGLIINNRLSEDEPVAALAAQVLDGMKLTFDSGFCCICSRRLWPLSTFIATRHFGSYRSNSGHWEALKPEAVAIDRCCLKSRSFDWRYAVGWF